jgi:hypothetical protein
MDRTNWYMFIILASNAQNMHIYPRIHHIMNYLAKESLDQEDCLFIHGGDYEGKILCSYSLFSLSSGEWLTTKTDSFCPQLKCHASTVLKDPIKGEQNVIIMGGIFIEHLNNCEAVTNKQKERCGCTTETISSDIYAYKHNNFTKINLLDRDSFGDRVRRLGHNLINYEDDILMLCGFAQYIGYMIDIIRFKVIENIKNNNFFLEGEHVEIKASDALKGRMFASVNKIFNYIAIYGGVRDDRPLNDLWLINMNTNEAIFIDVNTSYIYPRFGTSSIVYIDNEETHARLIIYGGSYWAGSQLVAGINNELLAFNFKFEYKNDSYYIFDDVDLMIPFIYGKGSKRVYHQSVCYGDKMLTFGGPNNLILQLSLINDNSRSYFNNLDAYMNECNFKILF